MNLSQELVNEILKETKISDVVGHYLTLSKKGKNYVSLCPFHDDHNPSLSISDEKGIYKCFVCGKGGNAFSFVKDYKQVSFPEAVQEVADIIGKPIKIDVVKKESKNQRYYDLNKQAADFFNYVLTGTDTGSEALEYLHQRGIDDELIAKFNIGFDPQGSGLADYLLAKGYSSEELVKYNLARDTGNKLYDVFAQRVTFPISDKDNNVVAFTARDVSGNENSAKYINSAETNIYTKGDILYNFAKAKEASKKSKRVIVCEGVIDVLAFVRSGYEFSLATLGTACSQKQLQLLDSLKCEIVFAYDGDKAGQIANLKNAYSAYKKGMQVKVIDNKTGLDPDEIVRKAKEKALRDMVDKAVDFMQYAIDYYIEKMNPNNYSDRAKTAKTLYNLISNITDEQEYKYYEKVVYDQTSIKNSSSFKNKKQSKKVYNKKHTDLRTDGLSVAEYQILAQMASSKEAYEIYKQEIDCLLNEDSYSLAKLIAKRYRYSNDCNLGMLYNDDSAGTLSQLITSLQDYDSNFNEDALRACIQKVRQELQKRKIEDLRKRVDSAITSEDREKLLAEYMQIVKDLQGGKDGEEKQ